MYPEYHFSGGGVDQTCAMSESFCSSAVLYGMASRGPLGLVTSQGYAPPRPRAIHPPRPRAKGRHDRAAALCASDGERACAAMGTLWKRQGGSVENKILI
eukprot:scaffold7123_cov119-Isochrysis_galbana.AAC.5